MVNRLALFVLLSISIISEGQSQQAKGSLFIIGGGSRPPQMIARIIKESGIDKAGYGIILPMSSSQPDSSVYYAQLPFKKAGVQAIYGLHFTNQDVHTKSKLDSILNAKLIYISGGDQNRFMDIVHNTEIENVIRKAFANGSIIAGTSAGAAVMSKVMITGNELKHADYASTFKTIEENNIETKAGLGLIDKAIIDQHFVRRSRYNRLISAVIEFPDLMGIGIDESTALLVKGNQCEVVGDSQILVFENNDKTKKIQLGKMGAKNIKLNIYLPGETFSLN